MSQYTTLSKRLHHCTLSETKNRVFTLSEVLDCVSIHCADQKQHSNLDFLTKSINITMPTCVDIANAYPQAINTCAGVRNYNFSVVFVIVIVQDKQCFRLHSFSLTNISERKKNIFHKELGQNSVCRVNREWLTALAVFPFMVIFSFYGWSFLFLSFLVNITNNTCYRFFAIVVFALLQWSCCNLYAC